MGALHDGHLSLVRQSAEQCDETVVSIFVNPTQFGPQEDLDKYPRTLEQDISLLKEAGASAVFIPAVSEMYPDGFSTYVTPPQIATSLEGICRPEHFRGVTTIVLKLFIAIPATDAFFGRKDYQQFKVIEAMSRDLNLGINLHGCETVRESDGLAMSSRNRYLSPADRLRALSLSSALTMIDEAVVNGQRNVAMLCDAMRLSLLGATAGTKGTEISAMDKTGVDKIDYATIVDANTMEPIEQIDGDAVALIAAHVGETRLIDNRIISAAK